MRAVCLSSALSMLLAAPVVADGIVIHRESTPAEREFIAGAKRSLKSALPAAPAGWKTDQESTLEPEGQLYFGEHETPLQTGYSARLRNVGDAEERAARYEKVAQDTSAGRAAMNKLTERMRSIADAMGKARDRGDRTAFEKAKAESEAAEREWKDLMNAPENPNALLLAAEREQRRDMEISLHGWVNPTRQYARGKLTVLDIPGSVLALRVDPRGPADEQPARALVLIGDWKIERRDEGEISEIEATHVFADGAPLTAAATAALQIEADPQRLTQLLSALRPDGLKQLVAAR